MLTVFLDLRKTIWRSVFSLWQDITIGYITVANCCKIAINTVWQQCASYRFTLYARSHYSFVLQEVVFLKKSIPYKARFALSYFHMNWICGWLAFQEAHNYSTYIALIVFPSIRLSLCCVNILEEGFRLCITPFSSVDGSHSTGTGFESIAYDDSRGGLEIIIICIFWVRVFMTLL